MTWVDLSAAFGYGTKLTSTQMQNLRDNIAALAAGDSGHPEIQTAAFAATIKPWILLSDQDASNDAAIDFTSVITSTYDEYIVLLTGVVPITNGANLLLRYSTDNGSTFKEGENDYWQVETYYTSITIASDIEGSTPAIGGVSGEIHLVDPSNATKYVKTYGIIHQMNSSSVEGASLVSGIYMASMDVDAIRFLMSSGNISTGTFKLYGILK